MPEYWADTLYDENHEAIMTTLYHCGEVLFSIAGWHNTDDMMKLYRKLGAG